MSEPRITHVAELDTRTGAQVAAVSGAAVAVTPDPADKTKAVCRVTAPPLPPPRPTRKYRVTAGDGGRWESTAARLDGADLVLDCTRIGGDS
jgi:hypothetical protein